MGCIVRGVQCVGWRRRHACALCLVVVWCWTTSVFSIKTWYQHYSIYEHGQQEWQIRFGGWARSRGRRASLSRPSSIPRRLHTAGNQQGRVVRTCTLFLGLLDDRDALAHGPRIRAQGPLVSFATSLVC